MEKREKSRKKYVVPLEPPSDVNRRTNKNDQSTRRRKRILGTIYASEMGHPCSRCPNRQTAHGSIDRRRLYHTARPCQCALCFWRDRHVMALLGQLELHMRCDKLAKQANRSSFCERIANRSVTDHLSICFS
jgi:hypothetical protein